MPAFAPDDDRDDDDHRGEGTDEEVDRLDEVKKQSDLDATRVDVVPMLFGEFPEGRIEKITAEPSSVATAEAVQEWKRQVTLIRLTDACPHCDGPIKTYGDRRNSDTIEYACQDCGDAWISEA